jgi:hypothetical protein
MKRYLLLRENQESGPYSVEDLSRKGLLSYDLIWEEGKSLQWMYPYEIPELSSIPVKRQQKTSTVKNTSYSPPPVFEEESVCINRLVDPVLVADEKVRDESTEANKFSFPNESKNSGLWIVGLVIALISSAFVVKNIVENFEHDPIRKEVSQAAIPVQDEMYESEEADPSYQNALTTEVIAVDTTIFATTKKPSEKELKKQVSLQATPLSTANDLQLTVKNASKQNIDRVTVEIKFLKPGGEVVKTEHFDVNAIPANGERILPIPDNHMGLKVKYRIVGIEAVHQKASIRNA